MILSPAAHLNNITDLVWFSLEEENPLRERLRRPVLMVWVSGAGLLAGFIVLVSRIVDRGSVFNGRPSRFP